jgi:signal transduction histidine kinase
MHSMPPWQHGPPPWVEGRLHKRRFLFFRFLFLFGGILILFLLAFAVVLGLLIKQLQPVGIPPPILILAACGVPLVFTILAAVMGSLAFRRIGTPMVDVMAAADAVADGDFSVRVREDIPGEYGRLARSFNRMTVELEHAEQQRRNLTVDVAHELRTPLHIIQGNLEGILDGVYEPTPEHISVTLEETYLLARLVSDLQTLSLAEAGQLPMHPIWFSAEELLSDTVDRFSGQAASSGVDLVVENIQAARDIQIYADPDRLNQVISNLVNNALRYTPAGGAIRLQVNSLDNCVRLTVEDTGKGISAEDLPYIFDRFWRGDKTRSHQGRAGSGLGLAIARQLVQAQGGEIRVESQIEKGTTFIIDLKTPDPNEEPDPHPNGGASLPNQTQPPIA